MSALHGKVNMRTGMWSAAMSMVNLLEASSKEVCAQSELTSALLLMHTQLLAAQMSALVPLSGQWPLWPLLHPRFVGTTLEHHNSTL